MDTGTGYRFHPSDLELVDHYLTQKMLGNDDEVWQIPEINVLSYEPWQLPEHAIVLNNSNDQVWYFFCRPNYKYSNSRRVDRTTNGGYWKVTGKDRKIQDIALKKTLVYYQGRPKGVRTNWIMHEYTPTLNFPTKRDYVICKIKKRLDAEDMANFEEGESSTTVAACADNQTYNYYNPNSGQAFSPPPVDSYATEEDTQVQAYMQSFSGYDDKDYNLDSAFQWRNKYYY